MTSTNDGKDVKINQTSGHKAKKYFVDLYNSLDARLNAPGSIREQTPHVCEAWTKIHSICRHAVPNIHPVLLAWLERHTATVLLQSEWQTDSCKDERASFKSALIVAVEEIEYVARIKQAPPQEWEEELRRRAEWFQTVADKPWDHPVLRILLDPQAKPPSDDEVLEWLNGEREVVLSARLRQLVAAKCDDLALSLIGAVLGRVRSQQQAETQLGASFDTQLRTKADFTDKTLVLLADIELVLLYKCDQNPRCIELAKLIPLSSGYEVIQRLLKRLEFAKTSREKKLWKNVKDVAMLIAQVIVTRCMVSASLEPARRNALCACAGELARLSSAAQLSRAAHSLARAARTAHHLYWLARAVRNQQKSDEMKPFICELYVRAITAGVNELENLKTDKKEVEALQFEQILASWFLELGQLFSANARFRCECTLTAFSMHPSPTIYERVKAAPTLKPLKVEFQEPKSESTSEFGSWANDSRTQTNLVKTSETLNLKHTKHNANVLSTAILTEGEALGLTVELCQDISMLLAGPREKTLSWDIDRDLLLKNCHTYMERTQCGTRAITTELKFLKVNPNEYQHLPEEDDEEENIYYGIEKGYEHLVEIEEPKSETIFPQSFYDITTESASDMEIEYKPKSRRKKNHTVLSDSDDPLNLAPETKERQHSKERNTERSKDKNKVPKERKELSKERRKDHSKERKKKVKQEKGEGKEKKEKKVRKKKDKQVQGDNDASSSLSTLIGIKVSPVDNEAKDVLYDGQFSMDELKSPEKSSPTDIQSLKNELASKKYRTQNKLSGQSNTSKSIKASTSQSSVAKLLLIRRQKMAEAQGSMSPYLPSSPSPVSDISSLIGAKIMKREDTSVKITSNKKQTKQTGLLKNESNSMLSNQTEMATNNSNNNLQVQKPVNSYSKPNPNPRPHVTYNLPSSTAFDAHQKCFQEFIKQQTSMFAPNTPNRKTSPKARNALPTELMSSQSAKSVGQLKKVDNAPNTFARLSYMHKNKQDKKPKEVETIENTPQDLLSRQLANELDEKIIQQRVAKTNVLKYLQKKGMIVTRPETPNTENQKVEVQTITSPPKLTPLKHNNPLMTNLLQSPPASFAAPLQRDVQPAPSTSYNQISSPKPTIMDKDQQELLLLLRQQSKLNANHVQVKSFTAKIDNTPIFNTIGKSNTTVQKSPSNTILNNQTPTISRGTVQSIKIMKSSDLVKNNLNSCGNKNKVIKQTPQKVNQHVNDKTVINSPALENKEDRTKVQGIKLIKSSDFGINNLNSCGNQNKPECRFGGPIMEQTPQKVNQNVNDKTLINMQALENKDDWTKVLDAIRAHKTPSRGPKALDMTMDRDSFARYTNKNQVDNLRNQRIVRVNQPKTHISPTVIKSTQNANEQHSKVMPKIVIETKNKPLKQQVVIQKVPTVKKTLPIDMSKIKEPNKFTCATQVQDDPDPFISGLPNSDYDLIGELMDDDLRRELGELSSDEERFDNKTVPKQSKTNVAKADNTAKKKPTATLPVKNKPLVVDPRSVVIAKNINDDHVLRYGNTKNINTNVIKGTGASASTANSKPQILSNEVINIGKLAHLTKPSKSLKLPKNVIKSVDAQIKQRNVKSQMQNQSNTSISQQTFVSPVQQTKVAEINKRHTTSPTHQQNNISIPQQTFIQQQRDIETNISNVSNQNKQHHNLNAPQSTFVQQPTIVVVAPDAYDSFSTLRIPEPPVQTNINQNAFIINNISNLPYQPTQFAPTIAPILINSPIAVQTVIPFQVQTIPVIQQPNIIPTNTEPMCSHPTMTASDSIEELIKKKTSDNKDDKVSKVVDEFNPELLLRNDFVANEEKPDFNPKNEIKPDIIMNKTSERKVLSEVQEKLVAVIPEKIEPKGPKLSIEDNVKIDNKEQERLKIKRLAIVNRKLNHYCGKPPIPLSYEPLIVSTNQESKKILSVPENIKLSKSCVEPNLNIMEKKLPVEESVVTEEIKNPDTPDSLGDVENKPAEVRKNTSCRRILLRSSNKLKTSPNSNKHIGRKTKVRLKSAVEALLKTENEPATPSTISNQEKIVGEEINNEIESEVHGEIASKTPDVAEKANVDNVRAEAITPTRISRRIREKKIKRAKQEKYVVNNTPPESKVVTEEEQQTALVQTSDAMKETTISEPLNIQIKGDIKEAPNVTHSPTICTNNIIIKTHESNEPKSYQNPETYKEQVTLDSENVSKDKSEIPLILKGDKQIDSETKTTNTEEINGDNTLKEMPFDVKTSEIVSLKVTNNEHKDIPKTSELPETLPKTPLLSAPKLVSTREVSKNSDVQNISKVIKEVKTSLITKLSTKEVGQNPLENILKVSNTKPNILTKKNKEQNKILNTPKDTKLNDVVKVNTPINKTMKETENEPVKPLFVTCAKTYNGSLVTPNKLIDTKQTDEKVTDAKIKTKEVITLDSDSETTNDENNTEPCKTNISKPVLSTEDKELNKFKEGISIKTLPIDKNNPNRREVRITLSSGKVFKAVIFGDVPVDIDSLFVNESVKKVLLGEFSGSKRCTLNVRQYTSVNNKKIIDTLVTDVSIPRPVPKTVETVNLVSDDEDDNVSTFVTEKGKYNITSIKKDVFEKHQNKFSQKCTVKLDKLPTTRTASPKKQEIIEELVRNLHEELIPKHVEEIIDVDSLDETFKEPDKNQPEHIDELKDKLLKDLGVASLIEQPVVAVESDVEEILPDITGIEVVSLDEDSTSESDAGINYSAIINRKCYVKLVNCDHLVTKMKKDDADIVITSESENEIDEPELRRSGSFSILNDLDVDNFVLANCDSDRSSPVIDVFETIVSLAYSELNENTYRRNSPVMEAFDLIANLRKPNITTGNHECTPVVCYSDWLEIKRNISAFKKLDSLNIETTNIEVINISTDCKINLAKTNTKLLNSQSEFLETLQYQNTIVDELMEEVTSVQYLDNSVICVSEYFCTKKQLAKIVKDTTELIERQEYEIVCNAQLTEIAEPNTCNANWFECKSHLRILALKQIALLTFKDYEKDCVVEVQTSTEKPAKTFSVASLTQIVTKYVQDIDITSNLMPVHKVKLKYRRTPTATLKRKFQSVSSKVCENVSSLLHTDIGEKRTKLYEEHYIKNHPDLDPTIAIEEISPFIPNEEIETLPVYDLVEESVKVLKPYDRYNTSNLLDNVKLLEDKASEAESKVIVYTSEKVIDADFDEVVTIEDKEGSEVDLPPTAIAENLCKVAETTHENDNQEIDKQNQIVSVYEDINVEVNTTIDVIEIPESINENVNSNSSNDDSVIWIENENNEDISVNIPKVTYSRSCMKRKADMSDIKMNVKKYRKGKNIDSPKLSVTQIMISAYKKEYRKLIDYCRSIKFSFSVSYDREYIDVPALIQNWPIQGPCIENHNTCDNKDNLLFIEEKDQLKCKDPLQQTLTEEINAEYEDNYPIDDSEETNFSMGFGEGSDRVIQNLEEDGVKFSAATLSDVKQSQPFLLSEDYEDIGPCLSESKSQTENIRRHVSYIQLRKKVRTFFEKSAAEINCAWEQENKLKSDQNKSSFPFDLYITNGIKPYKIVTQVQVVQVGQLPVSAAAQNPVTCDPRVTQVSDASPSQCSIESSPQDDSQSGIKTEYTELTTADLSMPLQDYAQHNQSMPIISQLSELSGANDNIPIETELIKSEVKIELIEENPEERDDMKQFDDSDFQTDLNNIVEKHVNNIDYDFDANDGNAPSETDNNTSEMFNPSVKSNLSEVYSPLKQQNGAPEKTDQLAHAMNAAGITASPENTLSPRPHPLVNFLTQKIHTSTVNTNQNATSTYSKAKPINAMSLHQALASILPPPLNQTSTLENNQTQNPQVTSQVLHIVQGKNASGNQITLVDNSQQSVINNPNATSVLHIVQNKSNTGATNGTPNPQQNAFSGLSLVDTGLQQGGNQLLQIVNTGNQKNANAGQLLKRVNLLTNLANVQGSNEQKMVQFVCKSADGKSIQLNAPHQRSMVLRLQTIETPTVQNTQPKPGETPDLNQSSSAANCNNKDSQEIKSRSVYEDNYAKFIQNSSSKTPTPANEKSTSLPKFNQAFGKTVFQDGGQKQNDLNNTVSTVNTHNENNECPTTENMNLELGQISNPPLLLRKSPAQTSQAHTNLVQQIKQTIAPMNIQTMHGGVIYTRQIPVNIGGGQTINLITVPTTELIDESGQKQQTDVKFINQGDLDPSIIKIVPQTQAIHSTDNSDDNNLNSNNDNVQTPQPQPVLTQMRIKLPMLSKTPQMMAGARVVRPSFFQIHRNLIGGANQPVYQQLVLTAAPPLGQQIRLQNPQAQATRPIKVPSESQSSTESMSSSTLEQLREFDMVLEQVKERSTVQPNSNSTNTFKLHTATTYTTDSVASSTSTETTQQVLYSIGNSQAVNVAYVNRKATVTTPTVSTFQRSPDSSGIVDSPSSSSRVQLSHASTSEASSSESHSTPVQHKPKHKPKTRPKASSNPPMKINPVPPKTSIQKPLEDEQTTQRILYILAEYKEQVENSPDKDKPAPRRRSNAQSNPGSSKRKKSSSGSRRHGRDSSPVHGDDTRTMGSEDSSCGTSQGDCTENCLESTSPQESPRKVARKLTFEQEVPSATPRPQPPRNVIVADGQTITVTRGTPGKPATAVLMPANYILPVSMVKGGQQIAIVTNRGPKLLTVAGEGGTTNALLLQRLIGPAGLKPMLTRPGVRHVRLPAAALQNLQAFNLATTASTVNPPDSTASPAPAPTPDLADSQAGSSPWADRESDNMRPERGSSPEGSEPWNLPSSADPQDYCYEETVRADNLDRTVLDQIPDRYSPDTEAQRIFDKMFEVDSKKSYIDSPRCGFDIDASDDDKAYHQVVHKKDLSTARQHRLAHVSATTLRHKYAILEHELRLQKSLSEECEDLGVDSPSASELFPEAELLFAASPAHDHAQETPHHSHTIQPLLNHTVIQPDIDDQIATDQLLTNDMNDETQALDVNLGLEDVGIVTVSEDGMQATIALDHEEFARAHPNTTFHSEPTEDGEVQQPFTITGLKSRHITSTIFHSNRAPATVLMTTPQTTVISQTTADAQNVKYDLDNMINLPSTHNNINLSSVLVKDDGLTRFDSILTDSRELHLSNTASAIVHSQGNATQVIRRVCYDEDKRERERYLMDEPDALIAGDDAKMLAEDNSSRDATLESMADDDNSCPEQNAELFWESNSASERSESRRPLDFSSDSEKCCKSPSYDETNSTDSSGVGTHMRLHSVIKEARVMERSGSADCSSADDIHPPLRTYPPKRSYHQIEEERSLSGKTRAGERSPHSLEVRRRASNRGVVKRGCHCCNGSPAPQRPKKPRQRKPTMDFTTQ